MNIGAKIKQLRSKAGLTQEQLAERLGISGQAVSKWENDNGLPDISLLVPIADYFDISLDYLFLRSDYSQGLEYDEIKERYTKARELFLLYPNNYRYHLKLADAEYQLALSLLLHPSRTFVADVLKHESFPYINPLFWCPNAIITPHIAGSLGNETERMADYMIEQFDNYINGKPTQYEITNSMLETMA